MTRKRAIENVVFPTIGVLLIAAFWAIFAACSNKPLLMPQVDAVFARFFSLFATGQFYLALLTTFLRCLCAYVAAFAVALGLSMAAASSRKFALILSPLVEILRSTPVVALILLLLVAFPSYVLPSIVAFLTLFPVLQSEFYESIMRTERQLGAAFKVFCVKPARRIRYAWLPALCETFFGSGKASLSLSVKVVVSGEILVYTANSVGLAMQSAQVNLQTDLLLAWTVAAVLLAFAAEGLSIAVHSILKRCKVCQ